MLHNYHTHTVRCEHALGTEREYIESAIKAGLKTLGFSDHAPYVEPVGDLPKHRVPLAKTEEYFQTIRALKKEYEKDIRILCGFELEYYPDYHKDEMAFLSAYKPDFLLLGQHFIANEATKTRAHEGKNDMLLMLYVTQVLAGLSTGDFLYLAHPDMAGYDYSEETWQREYRRLCEGAKRMDVPLEINLLGIRSGRWYPDERFYKIAADVGNKIVLGMDAHSPEGISDRRGIEMAEKMVKKFGLQLVEKLI